MSVVADGRQRLFPKGRSQLPPSSSRRPSKGRMGEHCNTIQPHARPTLRLLNCCRMPPASSSKSSPTVISPPVTSQCPIRPPPADTRARHACTLQTRFPTPTTLREPSPALSQHVIRIENHATTCSGSFTGQKHGIYGAQSSRLVSWTATSAASERMRLQIA